MPDLIQVSATCLFLRRSSFSAICECACLLRPVDYEFVSWMFSYIQYEGHRYFSPLLFYVHASAHIIKLQNAMLQFRWNRYFYLNQLVCYSSGHYERENRNTHREQVFRFQSIVHAPLNTHEKCMSIHWWTVPTFLRIAIGHHSCSVMFIYPLETDCCEDEVHLEMCILFI